MRIVADSVRRVIDAVSALLLVVGAAIWFVATAVVAYGKPRSSSGDPHLLVLDAAYSLEMMRDRELLHTVTDRDLDGVFSHVWWVHPLVGASPDHSRSVGAYSMTELTPKHTVIEVYVARTLWLQKFEITNFVLGQLQLGARLRYMCSKHPIAVVQAGDPYYLGAMGMILKWLFGTRLAIRVSGNFDAIYANHRRLAYPRIFRRRYVEKALGKYVLSRTDLVLAVNQDNLGFACRNGANVERSFVIPYVNMLHPAHFEPVEGRPEPDEFPDWVSHPRLVLVSRLEAVKHPSAAIEVLQQVRRRHVRATLVIVGDGAERPRLRDHARELGVDDAVWFAGARSQSWIASALPMFDVVLSPLTGRALVEATLSGTPVVAYDIEWQSELICHGETGLLVAFRDTHAMAAATQALIDDPEMARRLGQGARRHTLERMDPRTVRERERAAFMTVLS